MTGLVAAINKQAVKVVLQVQGMTCGHCESVVRKALSKVPGVLAIERVDRTENVVEVEIQPSVDAAALVAVVVGEGYTAAVSEDPVNGAP